MQKLILHFTLILIFGINQTTIAQDDNLSAVIKFKPIVNQSKASTDVCNKVYDRLIKSLDTKNRFVAFAEGKEEPNGMAATILAEVKISGYGVSQKTVRTQRPKDAAPDWKNPGPKIVTKSSIAGVINFTDISTGKKLDPQPIRGAFEERKIKTAIKTEGVSWSKKKGVHSTKKSQEDINKQKKNIAKEEAAWKKGAANKAINNAIDNWEDNINKFMPIDLKIKSIIEAKKNKAIRVMVDAGKNKDISMGDTYQVVELTSYEVGGKKLTKETPLGIVWVGRKKYIMETESSFKVQTGKKNIFEAINSNKNIALKLR